MEWNNEKVLDGDDFSDYANACFPKSSNLSLFTLNLDFSSTAATEIRFALIDPALSTLPVLESALNIDDNSNPKGYQRCISNISKCIEFITNDISGNGISFEIQQDNGFNFAQKQQTTA